MKIEKILTKTILLILSVSPVLACTSITLIGDDNKVVAGRTMDWELNWDWKLIYMPKGTEHTLSAPKHLNLNKNSYNSKFSVLGTGLIIDDNVVMMGGQNNKGLNLTLNYLANSKYQTVSKNDKKYASILEVMTLILSQCANVNQAEQMLKEYKVWGDNSTMVNGIFPAVHFLISDKSGNAVVVEYINHKVNFHSVTSDIKVLTNSPTYDQQEANLKDFIENNNSNKTLKNGIDNILTKLPGDYSSKSRFIKTYILASYNHKDKLKNEDLVTRAAHILDNVDIPKGTYGKASDENFHHSAYTTIRDLNNNKLYIRTYNHPEQPININLNKLDNAGTSAFIKSLSKLPYPKSDISEQLIVNS